MFETIARKSEQIIAVDDAQQEKWAKIFKTASGSIGK
jgi:hypothetical protein